MSSLGYFTLIQFFPDTDREERANLGLILEVPERAYQRARCLSSFEVVRCLDPRADVVIVGAFIRDIAKEVNSQVDRAEHSVREEAIVIPDLQDTFNTADRTLIRLSETKTLFIPPTQDCDARLELLFGRLVARPL